MIIGKGHLGPDIWPETSNQGTDTEEMIFIIWYKEAKKQNGINPQHYHLPISNAKEARYVSYTSSNYKNSYAHQITDTWFYHGIPGPYDRKNLWLGWHPLPVENNCAALLRHLSDEHAFLDPDLDKVWSPINSSYSYSMISLHNSLI